MSLLDKLLGRKPAETEDDSWMTDEQRAATLAWWESKWMDRIVAALALVLWGVALAGALALVGLCGWLLWSTPVVLDASAVTTDATRGASFAMIAIVLGVPVGLALFYLVLRTLYNLTCAAFKDSMNRTFHPLVGPSVCVVALAATAFFHQPAYGAVRSVYELVVRNHLLAKTKMFPDKPTVAPAPAPIDP